jgi:hypothetical protein
MQIGGKMSKQMCEQMVGGTDVWTDQWSNESEWMGGERNE